MKVILTQDLKPHGKKGQIIEASDGYARNFLLPKKLAVEATEKNLGELKNAENAKSAKEAKEKSAAAALCEKLGACTVKIKRTCGADEKMYGSVSSKDIAEELLAQCGIDVDKRKISLDEPIKTYGNFTAKIKIHPEISGNVNFIIVK